MFLLQPVRFLAEALTDESSSRQLALGFALGLVIGLVPKGNLTAISLMVLLSALRINLGAGMLAAFAFSWLGILIDPLTHQLGLAILNSPSLLPLWTFLYDVPLLPWTAFNNSVVLGSLLVGLVLFLPTYWLTFPLFERFSPKVQARLQKLRIVQLIWGVGIAQKLRSA